MCWPASQDRRAGKAWEQQDAPCLRATTPLQAKRVSVAPATPAVRAQCCNKFFWQLHTAVTSCPAVRCLIREETCELPNTHTALLWYRNIRFCCASCGEQQGRLMSSSHQDPVWPVKVWGRQSTDEGQTKPHLPPNWAIRIGVQRWTLPGPSGSGEGCLRGGTSLLLTSSGTSHLISVTSIPRFGFFFKKM